jgi:hypothetical protein
VKAALQARFYSLMIGGKGEMLNTPKSVPIVELLLRPVLFIVLLLWRIERQLAEQ